MRQSLVPAVSDPTCAVTDTGGGRLGKVVGDLGAQQRAHGVERSLMITSIRTVTWRGVGDLDAVATILGGRDVIGKKRAHGEGQGPAVGVRTLPRRRPVGVGARA